MKRHKPFLIALGAAAIVIALVFAFPLSFNRVFDGADGDMTMHIAFIDVGAGEGGFPTHRTVAHLLNYDEAAFQEIRRIMGGYSLRRTVRGITSTRHSRMSAQLDGNNAGFWMNLRIHNEDVTVFSDVMSGGTRRILINGRTYRMTSRRNIQMMNEIREALENSEPYFTS